MYDEFWRKLTHDQTECISTQRYLAMRVPLGKTPRKTLGKRFCLYFPLPRVFPLRKTPRETLGNASPCGKPWGKPRGKPWVRHGDILMFPGFFPWGNPYYSPWGKPCGAQSPYFPPWGKPWDPPWGKPRGNPRIHVPQGFPPGEKYVFPLGGRAPQGESMGRATFSLEIPKWENNSGKIRGPVRSEMEIRCP